MQITLQEQLQVAWAILFRQQQLHPLEVKGIADGEVATGIKGMDPVVSEQLTREEIERAEADSNYRMHLREPTVRMPEQKRRKGPRYTPLSRRQDRPDAIAWFLKHHPEVTDAQISKFLGTTKATIESVRAGEHWNKAQIKPVDPVTLGHMDIISRAVKLVDHLVIGVADNPSKTPLFPIATRVKMLEVETASLAGRGRATNRAGG